MSDELKPCPFCGSNRIFIGTDWTAWCHACGTTADMDTWNQRTPVEPEPEPSQIAESHRNRWTVCLEDADEDEDDEDWHEDEEKRGGLAEMAEAIERIATHLGLGVQIDRSGLISHTDASYSAVMDVVRALEASIDPIGTSAAIDEYGKRIDALEADAFLAGLLRDAMGESNRRITALETRIEKLATAVEERFDVFREYAKMQIKAGDTALEARLAALENRPAHGYGYTSGNRV